MQDFQRSLAERNWRAVRGNSHLFPACVFSSHHTATSVFCLINQ
jgi:hypothetical protein